MDKKKVVIISVVVLFFIVVGIFFYKLIINNDDFAPYTNKEYNDFYELKNDIYNLPLTKYELTEIAQKYENGVKLTYAQYDINENSKTAKFEFYTDDYGEKNMACIVTLYVNIDDEKVTKVKYEKGHGKRVSGQSSEIDISENLSDFINPNEDIQIVIRKQDIILRQDGQIIEKEDFVKNITNNLGENKYGGYEGIVTEINSNNITFEDKSKNRKYLIEYNSDFKCINGRTNEEIDFKNIEKGNYIHAFINEDEKIISILSNISGEELKKELLKNLTLENCIDTNTRVSVYGETINIENSNKAILTLKMQEYIESQDIRSEEFEVKVELNSNTDIECKGLKDPKIEDLKDVLLDVINVRLDETTLNNEIPVVTWFLSSNGN